VTRFGLIGAGAWGRRYMSTIARRSDCRLVAVARASGRAIEDAPDLPNFTDYRALFELCSRGELDAVIVATTPEHQGEVAQAAVEHGVPILAEKPLGFSRRVSEELLASWTRSAKQVPVLVDFVHLWSPAWLELGKRLANETSEISGIIAAGCGLGPFRGWSSLYDYGPHDAAMLLRVLGTDSRAAIGEAHKSPSSLGPSAELFDFQLTLRGVPVSLTLGNGSPIKRRLFAVELANGRKLVYDDTRPAPEKLNINGESVAVSTETPLDGLLSDFIARIQAWRGGHGRAQTEAELSFAVAVANLVNTLATALPEAPHHTRSP
jgi:predicted dehydrogenase